MWSTCHERLTENVLPKIEAICWGLAACSLILFLAWLGNIQRFCPFVVLDDRFFGFQSDWFWIYYLVDMLVQATILGLLRTRPKAATCVGILWTSLLLLETLGDLSVFVHDVHMVLEETLFALIYAYLLLLLVTHGRSCGRTGTGTLGRSTRSAGPAPSAPGGGYPISWPQCQ